jgi:RimJ/RimL family protein N-acetyltransferase
MDSIAAIETTELHGLFADPQVRHYLCDDQVLGMDRVRSIIEGSIAHFRESGLGLWMVSDGLTAERAGIVGFSEFSAPGALELMYAFYPRFWGRGLATETARAVMERGFTAGLDEIHASTDEPNQASIAVLQRLGFRKTGGQEATPPTTVWPQLYFKADAPRTSRNDQQAL